MLATQVAIAETTVLYPTCIPSNCYSFEDQVLVDLGVDFAIALKFYFLSCVPYYIIWYKCYIFPLLMGYPVKNVFSMSTKMQYYNFLSNPIPLLVFDTLLTYPHISYWYKRLATSSSILFSVTREVMVVPNVICIVYSRAAFANRNKPYIYGIGRPLHPHELIRCNPLSTQNFIGSFVETTMKAGYRQAFTFQRKPLDVVTYLCLIYSGLQSRRSPLRPSLKLVPIPSLNISTETPAYSH